MDRTAAPAAFHRIDRLLRDEPVVWLSSVRPEGGPHLVPIWFSWDGRQILIASKPHAQKIRNLRANPNVMLALGEAEDDFDVGLLEGRASCWTHRQPRFFRLRTWPSTEPDGFDRPLAGGIPHDLLAGDPHRPNAIPAVARPDVRERRGTSLDA